jgi:hypothetical protein
VLDDGYQLLHRYTFRVLVKSFDALNITGEVRILVRGMQNKC